MTDSFALSIKGGFVLVDQQDLQLVRHHVWYVNAIGHLRYAKARIDGRMVAMHRYLLSVGPDAVVDHINGDGLDNRRSNLRVCTTAENTRNKRRHRDNITGFKGVHPSRNGTRYHAQIRCGDVRRHIGTFDTPQQAHAAYCAAAAELHGEYANPG